MKTAVSVERLVGLVAGLLAYESLSYLSQAFVSLHTRLRTPHLGNRPESMLCLFGYVFVVWFILYLFAKAPLRHALWIGPLAGCLGWIRAVAFSYLSVTSGVPDPSLAISLGTCTSIIISPLLVCVFCHLISKQSKEKLSAN